MTEGNMERQERTTTITVRETTAREIRRLVGALQLKTGRRITQREIVESALKIYKESIEVDI